MKRYRNVMLDVPATAVAEEPVTEDTEEVNDVAALDALEEAIADIDE